jgi:Fe-S cluster assembly protein SufD
MAVAEAQDLYLTQFDRLDRARGATDPAWLRELRKAALVQFRAERFPTTRDEEFRFTPVSAIADRAFAPTFEGPEPLAADDARAMFEVPGLTANELVFVNGRFSRELSSLRTLPQGVRVTTLGDALTADPGFVQTHLHRHIKLPTQGFTALNTAFLHEGAVIVLPDGAIVEDPIHLVFLSNPAWSTAGPFVAHPRTLVVAGRNSQARILASSVGRDVYFTNAVTEIVGGDNSHVDHYRVQRESLDAFHVSGLHVHLSRSATFSSHNIVFGGGVVRNDVNAVLDAEGIVCTLNGLYLVDGKRLVDNHTAIDHARPHCESHELYKGILDDQAHGVFNGKIFVRQDAQKTDAKQTNQVLLLSEDAVINTKPQLEIFADDVKCTHGATVGQLDADAIFYLRSRGIDLSAARKLLTYAFANDILGRIKIDAVRERLEHALTTRPKTGNAL